MFQWLAGLAKLVTLVSTIMLAFEQMRKMKRDRDLDRKLDEERKQTG